MLAGCGLLPVEEEFQQSPVINTYVAESFEFVYVERGDIVNSTTLTCIYMPARSESYKFQASGEPLDEIFVKVGDPVVEGQLLAQLNVDSYLSAITSVQNTISRLELQLQHLEEWREVELSRAGSDADARRRITESYDAQRQSLDDQLYIQRLQLEEYEHQLARRQIRAGFDGTVTYVTKADDNYRSSSYSSVVSIADSASSTFQAETAYWDRFSPGDSYTITVGKVPYAATVVDETTLGLPPEERVEGKKANIYLVLDEVTFELEDGDRGALVLILDQRLDVLKLPTNAVSILNGQSVVYYQDENGTKRYKPVTEGLTGNKEVEIIEGVAEGEAIIVK